MLRWLLEFGNTSLEKNLRLKSWDYLLFLSVVSLLHDLRLAIIEETVSLT